MKPRASGQRPLTDNLQELIVTTLAACIALLVWAQALAEEPALPSASEMAAAREDVWAEAAIRAPGGPSFEFFRDLLPPLRYANTDFRHYPIVLCAPRAAVKARWISNGSAVNARANKKPMWREVGTPVHFFVGAADEPFGAKLELLDGPRYAERLQLLAFYYWQTRDAAYLREHEAAWTPVVELITRNLQPNGLLPPDNYAGDIKQQVVSLSSNSTCWRGLRDLAAVLDDLGDDAQATKLHAVAAGLRRAILDLVQKCEHRDVQPPFIPISLAGDEPPHDPLTATRIGSYYDLMAPYVIGSGVFAPDSDRGLA